MSEATAFLIESPSASASGIETTRPSGCEATAASMICAICTMLKPSGERYSTVTPRSSAALSTPFLTTDQNGSEAWPWLTTTKRMSWAMRRAGDADHRRRRRRPCVNPSFMMLAPLAGSCFCLRVSPGRGSCQSGICPLVEGALVRARRLAAARALPDMAACGSRRTIQPIRRAAQEVFGEQARAAARAAGGRPRAASPAGRGPWSGSPAGGGVPAHRADRGPAAATPPRPCARRPRPRRGPRAWPAADTPSGRQAAGACRARLMQSPRSQLQS